MQRVVVCDMTSHYAPTPPSSASNAATKQRFRQSRPKAALPPGVRKASEAVKKSGCRGGPCGRPARAGATIPRLRDPYGAMAKRDSFTASLAFPRNPPPFIPSLGWKAQPSSREKGVSHGPGPRKGEAFSHGRRQSRFGILTFGDVDTTLTPSLRRHLVSASF